MAENESHQRLLIVEDDKGIRDLLADRLNRYELVFSVCQSECFANFDSSDFDLVLLDLRLPRTTSDMGAANQVGLDILKQIRSRGLTKRGSAMLLPVVVMTAYGSETLSVDVLIEWGANDYIPKPFGQGQDLEHKIERALSGEGALIPASNIIGAMVRVYFHPKDPLVRIESLSYDGSNHGLLKILGDLYTEDLRALRAPENFNGIRGEDLGKRLEISGKAARQRVVRFREQVKDDFRTKLGRAIGDNDIIENVRNWEGYRLNPRVVRVLGWDQAPVER
ncbi:MAG TPA: response regulator [Kofleriaceae bacterium]|nr:response regulator [Kofleriaceae bacterium]